MKNRLLKRVALCIALGAGALLADAAAPQGYYNALNGKRDAALKTAVKNIVANHTQLNYNGLATTFEQTDVWPQLVNGRRRWWDMYSDEFIYLPWNGTLLNREHSFPKSWWGGGSDTPAYTDINHLYPSEAKANMAKSNWPLGEVVGSVSFDNAFVQVGAPAKGQGGGSTKVFEPNDEYKGDFARTYFYMVTVYDNLQWVTKYMWMMDQNTYPTLKPWASEMLLRWARQDQVSEKEINRNDAVYRVQGNRNPFIDNPDLMEYIWGNKKGQTFDISVSGDTDPALISPSADMSLDFTQVAQGNTTTADLWVKSQGLRSNLRVRMNTLLADDHDMFSVAVTTLPYTRTNSDAGYTLTVTYKPTAIGEHTAQLMLYDGGLAGSVSVTLRGQCKAVPQLARLTATEATEVEATQYQANWLEPTTGSAPDYYVVTRTRHIGTKAYTEDIVAEGTSVIIDNFEDSDYDTYTVRSASLGYFSEPSNEIRVNRPAGIDDIPLDRTVDFFGEVGGIRVMVGRSATWARVIDPLGRVIATVDNLVDGMLIPVPSGIYVVETLLDEPIKVVVK